MTTMEDAPITRAAILTFVQEIVEQKFKPLFKQLADANKRLDRIEEKRRTAVARHAEMGMKFVATELEAKLRNQVDAYGSKLSELQARRDDAKLARLYPANFEGLSAVEKARIHRERAMEL